MSSFTPCARGFSIWITAFAFIASCAAAAAQDRSWVERSDRNTAMVFETLGAFYPEWMSHLGLDRFDPYVIDLKPGRNKRLDAALAASVKRLAGAKDGEGDVRVREDLEIVIDALERMRRTGALEERLLVPYFDVPRHVFQGLRALLDARNPEPRRRAALQRLRRYAGMEPGTTPFAELARERTNERAQAARPAWPYRGEVQQHLANCERYIAGIAEIFRAGPAQDWQAAYERLAAQLREHCDWVRSAVLPRARPNPQLPRELYAQRLKNAGVDISPEEAISLGTASFAEIRDEMLRVAADIARERKLPSSDYRAVRRAHGRFHLAGSGVDADRARSSPGTRAAVRDDGRARRVARPRGVRLQQHECRRLGPLRRGGHAALLPGGGAALRAAAPHAPRGARVPRPDDQPRPHDAGSGKRVPDAGSDALGALRPAGSRPLCIRFARQ